MLQCKSHPSESPTVFPVRKDTEKFRLHYEEEREEREERRKLYFKYQQENWYAYLQSPCPDTTEPSCDHKCTGAVHLVHAGSSCHTVEIFYETTAVLQQLQ